VGVVRRGVGGGWLGGVWGGGGAGVLMAPGRNLLVEGKKGLGRSTVLGAVKMEVWAVAKNRDNIREKRKKNKNTNKQDRHGGDLDRRVGGCVRKEKSGGRGSIHSLGDVK